MGGTTAKVSLVQNSEPSIAQGYYIGGLAAVIPSCCRWSTSSKSAPAAQHRLDRRSRRTQVGRAAPAVTRPVCYGQGGTAPTVTDANVILGRLSPSRFLAVRCRSMSRCAGAIRTTIAAPLDLTVEAAALGIIKSRCGDVAGSARRVGRARLRSRDFAMSARARTAALGGDCARAAHPYADRPRVPGHFPPSAC